MQFQIGKLSYNVEQTPSISEFINSKTLADSALYTHYNIPYYNPSKLYEKKGSYDLYDDMREDDQVSAVLNLMKYIILGADWDVDTEHEKAKEFLKDNFNNLDETFSKKLYNILMAMDYGYSLTEIILKQEEGKIKLDKLKTRFPHNFDFYLDDYGNILTKVDGSKTTTYTYDKNNRILSEEEVDVNTTIIKKFSYDENGNSISDRTEIYTKSPSSTENTINVNDSSVKIYEYNLLNQQIEVTTKNGTTTYKYNASGLRDSKTTGTDETKFLL